MKPFRIVITDNLFDDCKIEEQVFAHHSVELEVYRNLTRAELESVVKDADALLVNMISVDRKLIEKMNRCKIISRYGIGYDNVDVIAAKEAGIAVGIVPDYCHIEVAEHAAGLLLSTARRIPQRHELVRKGHWRDSPGHRIHRIRGSVLGILGFGRTGQAFLEQVKGFGFSRVLVSSEGLFKADLPEGVDVVSFDELLSQSDYLSVHLPLNDQTHNLLDEERLMSMKEGAVLINTARGGIISEEGLVHALTKGPLRAAGLDVLEQEPPDANNPLISLDNVVISDHEAYYSEQSVYDLKRKTAENVLAMLVSGRGNHTL